MKFVAFYDVDPGAMTLIKQFYPAHRARLDEFHSKGFLLAAGPLGNPPKSALAIFSSREAATAFIQEDPFVVKGVVSAWRIEEWGEVYL